MHSRLAGSASIVNMLIRNRKYRVIFALLLFGVLSGLLSIFVHQLLNAYLISATITVVIVAVMPYISKRRWSQV